MITARRFKVLLGTKDYSIFKYTFSHLYNELDTGHKRSSEIYREDRSVESLLSTQMELLVYFNGETLEILCNLYSFEVEGCQFAMYS